MSEPKKANEKIIEVDICDYLYPIRVELPAPLIRGSWRTTVVTYIVRSLQEVSFCDGVLTLYRAGQSDVKIPNPVIWEVLPVVLVPKDVPEDTRMDLCVLEGDRWDMNTTIAIWIDDGFTTVAYLSMAGEIEKYGILNKA